MRMIYKIVIGISSVSINLGAVIIVPCRWSILGNKMCFNIFQNGCGLKPSSQTTKKRLPYFDDLVQDSSALAMEILQFCSKPSIINTMAAGDLAIQEVRPNRWVNARKTQLQCVSSGVTSFCTNPSICSNDIDLTLPECSMFQHQKG